MGKNKRPNDNPDPNDNNKRPPLFIHLINCMCFFVLCNFPRKLIPTKL